MIVLLDTTVLIDALRARNDQRRKLERLIKDGAKLVTAAINVAEVYAGMRTHEQSPTETFLSSFAVLDLTTAIAQRAGMAKAMLARQGRTLSLADAIVAATALQHGCVLMTENRKDFVLTGVKLIEAAR